MKHKKTGRFAAPALLALALLLLALGVLGGGYADVMRKAIFICLECIGLG